MHPPTKPLATIQEQELSPDAAGLEPLVDGRSLDRRAKPTHWADQPVTIRSILTLAMPTVVEQMVAIGIGFTDTIIAGHTGATPNQHAAATGAVGAMSYLQWLAALLASALGVGATAIVARSIGAKRPRVANRVAGTVLTAGFLTGLAVAIIFFLAAPALVWLFSLRDQAAIYGVQYLRIMSWTICLQTAGIIGMSCLRGAGDFFRPMLITIAITVVNAFFSWALTFGKCGFPAWGVQGNATGTLLAFIVQGVLTFAFLLSGRAGLRLQLRHLRIVPHVLIRVARIAIPSFGENFLLWTGQTLIVTLVMRQVDDSVGVSGMTLAAHTAALRIESLAYLPGYGFGFACATLVGQYLGAGKPDQAERSAVLCNRLAFITMTTAAIPMVLFPAWMLHWMVDSPATVALGWLPLMLAGLAQPAFGISIIKSSALKGAGDTISPMLTTMIGMGGRVIAVLAIMAILTPMGHANWGLTAVWICIFFDLGFRGLAMTLVFRRGKWKTQAV